jgi:hypothetical protein
MQRDGTAGQGRSPADTEANPGNGEPRHDDDGDEIDDCAKTGTIAVTIIAGPLNYVGVNPKVSCTTPQPSK